MKSFSLSRSNPRRVELCGPRQKRLRQSPFLARLLISVLATLIALEPTARSAQDGQGARFLPYGHQPYPHASYAMRTILGSDLPLGGYVDLYHNLKDARELTYDGDGLTSRNVSAAMYVLRNTAVLESLERQIGIRYLIGGEKRAEARFEKLQNDYFDRGWFWGEVLFEGRKYQADFAMDPGVRTLYVGPRTPIPRIGDYAMWLDDR